MSLANITGVEMMKIGNEGGFCRQIPCHFVEVGAGRRIELSGITGCRMSINNHTRSNVMNQRTSDSECNDSGI